MNSGSWSRPWTSTAATRASGLPARTVSVLRCGLAVMFVLRTVVRTANTSRWECSADGAVVRRALLGERVGDRVRRLDEWRQDPAAQVVERYTRHGRGHVERGNRVRPAADGGRHRAQADLELLVDQRPAALARLVERRAQSVGIGRRPLGPRRERGP